MKLLRSVILGLALGVSADAGKIRISGFNFFEKRF